ncbi:MAG: ASPIC/UnbV domain-containing protein [Pirellulaceae bacterium]
MNNPRIDPAPVVETQHRKRASDDAWESRLLSVRAVLLLAVLLGIAVCSGGWFFFLGETESEDHARMLTLLRDIERRTPQENPVMGDVEIKKASLKLASLPSEGYLLDRFKLNWTLGKQHLALEQQRSVYKWVNSGGSFGANPLRQQIGVGKATVIHRLEVYWPTSQLTQQFEEIEVDQFIEIEEGSTRVRKLAWKTLSFHRQEN